MNVGFAVPCTEVINCCFLELEKMWWKHQSKTLSFFFNVSPSRSQQFFSWLLPVMLNAEGCMRWAVDNSARFVRHLGRMNQETKKVHLEQGEILWSWLRVALIVFRLSVLVQQSKNPLLNSRLKPCFPLVTYLMSWYHFTGAVKPQCCYDVWCQSLTTCTPIIWMWQSFPAPVPEISCPGDLGTCKAVSETDYAIYGFPRAVLKFKLSKEPFPKKHFQHNM